MDLFGPCLRIGDALIAADLHLGFEDRQAGSSSLVTRAKHVVVQLEERAVRANASRIVLAGDVIDDFALKSLHRRVEIARGLRRLARDRELVLIHGNHDAMLPTLDLDVAIHDSFVIDDTLVAHGDRPLDGVASPEVLESCTRIVIGHEHPVLALDDGLRLERFKCVVRIPKVETPFGAKEIVVLPSAHPDVLGTDVSASFRSPVISGVHPEAQVIVLGDPPRSFGAIGSLATRE